MKAILPIFLLVTVALPMTASAPVAGNCRGVVESTGSSPILVLIGNTLNVRAGFHGEGPGYVPNECDIGWVTTCRLEVNGVAVPAVCAHTNGEDRCHEVHARPYACDVDLFASRPVPSGVYTISATLGMRWGCCGWIGGPEATQTMTWTVFYLKA